MTKPEPVCGALTHKKTPCQNTLVTGCGLCPVHASQLRAVNGTFKQRSKGRRKKASTTLLQTDKLSPSTLVTSAISLNDANLAHTSVTNHRAPHPTAHPDATLLPEQLLYNITPIQQPQTDFYQEQPAIQGLKNETEVLDILKANSLTIVSPVTPRAPESLKGDFFAEEQLREECVISSHAASTENDLDTCPESYLLEVDLSMDLPMPKFD